MASSVHTHSKDLIISNDLDIETDAAIRLMLLKSSYDAQDDPDVDFIDAGGANDPIDHEADCTGYTGGHLGAGRKALDNRVLRIDDANNRVEFDFDDEDFGALGNGANNTLGSVMLMKNGSSDDTDALAIANDDVANVTTNGSTITYQPNVEGMLQF